MAKDFYDRLSPICADRSRVVEHRKEQGDDDGDGTGDTRGHTRETNVSDDCAVPTS